MPYWRGYDFRYAITLLLMLSLPPYAADIFLLPPAISADTLCR